MRGPGPAKGHSEVALGLTEHSDSCPIPKTISRKPEGTSCPWQTPLRGPENGPAHWQVDHVGPVPGTPVFLPRHPKVMSVLSESQRPSRGQQKEEI